MSRGIRFITNKKQDEITSEWDRIAPKRDLQIATKNDKSFTTILEPWILSRISPSKSILDIGCGTGRLTSEIAKLTNIVVGIDPSIVSIGIAREHDKNSTYFVNSIEEFASYNKDSEFDIVVANMVLMDVLDLNKTCSAISQLSPHGRVVITITHPAFWPLYWKYEKMKGFNYLDELLIEAPFKTSSAEYSFTTTHIHRSLSTYFNVLQSNGLHIANLTELRGPETTDVFPFPRFLGIEALHISEFVTDTAMNK